MQGDTKWTSRVNQRRESHHGKQGFHNAHVSLAGHWIREVGILAPVVISEFMEDLKQQRRWIRMASVGTALLSQGLYTYNVHQRREEARAREAERCPA